MGDAKIFYVEHIIIISIIHAANEVLACPVERMLDALITSYRPSHGGHSLVGCKPSARYRLLVAQIQT